MIKELQKAATKKYIKSKTSSQKSLNNIPFLFRSQETARFENSGQPAVTLKKS